MGSELKSVCSCCFFFFFFFLVSHTPAGGGGGRDHHPLTSGKEKKDIERESETMERIIERKDEKEEQETRVD